MSKFPKFSQKKLQKIGSEFSSKRSPNELIKQSQERPSNERKSFKEQKTPLSRNGFSEVDKSKSEEPHSSSISSIKPHTTKVPKTDKEKVFSVMKVKTTNFSNKIE